MKWIILIISIIVYIIGLFQIVEVSLVLDTKTRRFLSRGIILIILWATLLFIFTIIKYYERR